MNPEQREKLAELWLMRYACESLALHNALIILRLFAAGIMGNRNSDTR